MTIRIKLFAAVATPPMTVAPATNPMMSLDIVLKPLIRVKMDIRYSFRNIVTCEHLTLVSLKNTQGFLGVLCERIH